MTFARRVFRIAAVYGVLVLAPQYFMEERVGRDFPPFEKSHVRLSFGTMDEMKRAVGIFGQVLGVKAVAA